MGNLSLKYRADIDGLRAVAVLSVVAFHASSRLLSGGFVGVDIFFVISGYLISKIIFSELKDGTFSFLHFYSRRIRRIFPSLILVLASSWAVGYIWLSPSDYESLGKHIVAGAGFVANFGYWQETGYFDTASDLKPLLHLWSLGVEEQFYVVWPIILLASWKFLGNFGRVIVVALVASFAMNVVLIQLDPADAFYLPVSRFWELLVGGGLAWLSISQNVSSFSVSEKARHAISIAGATLILVALFGINKAMLFPGWWAILPVVGAALLIFAGPTAIVNKQVLSCQPVVFVGLISYPLYLWHWPMFAFTRIAGHDFKYRAVATVFAFVLSYLTYRYFEQPIRSGALKTNRQVPIILSILIFCIGCVGAATYQSAGYAKRFPDYIANVIRYDKTFDLGVWRSGTCFNLKAADYEHNFDEVCKGDIVRRKDGGVLLWGDSIAASLFPGLAKFQSERGYALAQYTTSNCPPFLEFDSPYNKHCRSVNLVVADRIIDIKPETVVLSGYWIEYTNYAGFTNGFNVTGMLAKTIAFLQASGVKRIIIVGPLPLWRPELPKIVFSEWTLHKEIPTPAISSIGLEVDSFAFDKEMAAKVRPLGVEYVSAMEILCDGKACMTRVGEDWRDLTTFDTMHLTEPGAYFLAKRIFNQTGNRTHID
jgi:peptidoglycan/LPS O-acetylase OafA/YrhL